ncbi:MAG: hypothetical protein B7Z29_17990 [Hyphomicrobium sp. 12-62-95]|nr:MAG: hypothetical protein B7Z29_17990 [Hyphomicrobium sp. 12-62-95]
MCRLPTTGLRFFTVYGPWGRPDMALFVFARAILAGEPIKVFNHGQHTRDFTYIDDIVEGVILGAYIEAIEAATGKTAITEFLPLQPGDVPDTFADMSELVDAVGYQPATPVTDGVRAFVAWYRSYYGR